jgi:scyllo-inositol 2-dehydrogenase (NADP+)
VNRQQNPRRVALIGYGLAGEAFHAPFVATVPGLRLDAIVVANPERRARAAAAHPRALLLDSAEAIWTSAGEFDLVVVAAPNRVHAELAHAAIAAGIAVVVDKPLARSAAEGRELATAATEAGVMLTVFQNRRWDGDFLTARALVETGDLGRIARFESRFEHWRPRPSAGWRESADPDEAGGVLFDLGSHLIDQALHLFGPADSVYAEVATRRPEAAVDDDAFVALTHASGVTSHLWMSAVAAQAGPRLRVLGDRGSYVKHGLDPQEAELRSGQRRGGTGWGTEAPEHWGLVGADGDARPLPTLPGAYQRFYEGVAASLGEGSPPPVDPADAVAGLEVIEAARTSSDEGRVVTLR